MFRSPLTFTTRTSILVGLICAIVVYAAGGLLGDYASDWYRGLIQPDLATNYELNRKIPFIWAALYLLDGVALAAVLAIDRGTPWKLAVLTLFGIQTALNLYFTVVFTHHHDLPGAVRVAAGLTAATAVLVSLCANGRVWLATVCLLPYLAWCGFATYLANEIARLNAG